MTNFIKWSNNDKCKVKIIDHQHAEIVQVINKIHNNLKKDNSLETIKFSENLLKFLKEHFDSEEQLMRKFNDPNFISHKLEHERMYKKTEKYLSNVINKNDKIDFEFLKSFRHWMFNHLDFNDKRLGTYLNSKGFS